MIFTDLKATRSHFTLFKSLQSMFSRLTLTPETPSENVKEMSPQHIKKKKKTGF